MFVAVAPRLTVFVHVDWIWPRGLRLGVRVDLSRPKLAHIVGVGTRLGSTRSGETEFFRLLGLGLIEELLVALETLSRSAADDGRDRAPLRRHELSKVEKLLILGLKRSSWCRRGKGRKRAR